MIKIIFIFCSIISFNAFASLPWTEAPDSSWSKGGITMFTFDDQSESGKVSVAEISRDSSGNLTMFFNYFIINDGMRPVCNYNKTKDFNNEGQHVIEGTSVHKFNNQPVKMTGFCVGETEQTPPLVYFRPQTDEGLEFIVQQFKDRNSVTIETSLGEEFKKIKFTAKGFTKYWDSNNIEAL